MDVRSPFSSVKKFIEILQTRKLNYQKIERDNNPVVSIISSFYNDAQYFNDAYESINNQTFQNYEWIVVDDCSTDLDSINIFNSLEQKNSQIKTFRHRQNKGPAAGRNRAVSYARGKYLFFLDTDDIIEPTYIEKCVLFLETHPEFSLVNSCSVGFQEEEYWWSKGFNTPNKFITENLVTGRVLFKKTDFEKIGGYDESLRYGEDWDLWLKALSNHQKAFTIPEYLDCYRRRKSGLLEIASQDSQLIEHTKELLQSRYGNFFQNTNLADVTLGSQSYNQIQKPSSIDITNLVNCNNTKRVFCFLLDFTSKVENIYFLELIKELNKNNYSITLCVAFDTDNELYSEFYQVTADIFYLCNIFDYFDWASFINYIILSRDINLILIYNFAYIYYLLPQIACQLNEPLFVGFNYLTKDENINHINAMALSRYSTFLSARIDNYSLFSKFDRDNSFKYQEQENNICSLNFDERTSSVESVVEFLESILRNKCNLVSKSVNRDTNFPSSHETLVWIEECLKAKQLSNDSLELKQEIEALNAWNQKITKERDIYKNQVQAWIKTAKSIQLDLNKAN